MVENEPLESSEVRRLIRSILNHGQVVFSDHAYERMHQRSFTEARVLHIIRAGLPGAGEWERGTWRYPIWMREECVVVAFDSETMCIIVTVVRRERR